MRLAFLLLVIPPTGLLVGAFECMTQPASADQMIENRHTGETKSTFDALILADFFHFSGVQTDVMQIFSVAAWPNLHTVGNEYQRFTE